MTTSIESTAVPSSTTIAAGPEVPFVVEYWTVAMDGQSSCGSCDETLTLVNDVVRTVRPQVGQLGFTIEVVSRTVTTWVEALGHGIGASPTVRAAGSELRPFHADDSDTRLWEWRGATTTSVRPEAVLDFLVRALAARSEQLDRYLGGGGPAPYVRQFLSAAPAIEKPGKAQASDACGCG